MTEDSKIFITLICVVAFCITMYSCTKMFAQAYKEKEVKVYMVTPDGAKILRGPLG
jgi:hypothetical protein